MLSSQIGISSKIKNKVLQKIECLRFKISPHTYILKKTNDSNLLKRFQEGLKSLPGTINKKTLDVFAEAYLNWILYEAEIDLPMLV
jgi:hypothetical protein